MNQQQNAISLARVNDIAVSLVGEFQVLNLVKHRLGIYQLGQLATISHNKNDVYSIFISCRNLQTTLKKAD